MKRLEENKAATYVKQVLQAIQYLHHNEIMHRDIKPENIMMSNVISYILTYLFIHLFRGY